jgi:ElaB/YqjD/DUF883 family membrane-anchored ribosome-binding protein
MASDTHQAKTSGARTRLAHHLDEIVTDARELLKSAEEHGSDQVHAARDELSRQIEDTRSSLARIEDRFVHRARRTVKRADRAIREHPYASLGLGAGLCVLLGAFLWQQFSGDGD